MTNKKKKEVVPIFTQDYQVSLASELSGIERQLAVWETRKDEIRAELLNIMKTQGIRSVRLDSNEWYIRAQRNKLIIKDQHKAKQWALENPEARMKIDTSAALEVARMGVPFFEVGHTEYLTVKRRSQNNEINAEVDDGS